MSAKKPAITMKPVKSSNIAAHGYDAGSRTLAVKFKSGDTYHYQDVAPELADKFGKADSMGGFFAAHIRGKFTGAKFDAPRHT